METRPALITRLNVSQLNDLALATKEIAELPTATPIVDSTDDTTEVELYADANNVSETNSKGDPVMFTKSGDQYMPINLDFGSLFNPAPAVDPNALTEEEKRKRTIIIASVVLLLLIVLVSIISLKKSK